MPSTHGADTTKAGVRAFWARLLLSLSVAVLAAASIAPLVAFADEASRYDSFPWDRYFTAGSGYFEGVAVDSVGNVYATQYDGESFDRVVKFSPDGSLVATWGSSGSGDGQLSNPSALSLDASGNILVTDVLNSRVVKFNGASPGSGFMLEIYAGDEPLQMPYGVVADVSAGSGWIYVADMSTDRVFKFTSSGAWVAMALDQSTFGPLNGPSHIEIDPISKDLYVVDASNNRVLKYAPVGNDYVAVAQYSNGSDPTKYTLGLALGIYGDVFTTDYQRCVLNRYAPGGSVLATIGSEGSGQAQFQHPTDLAVDSSGNLYIADLYNERIQKLRYQPADAETMPPVTTSNIPTAAYTWSKTPFNLVLTAWDASSTIKSTHYSTDGSYPTNSYTGTVSVPGEGALTVKYYSVDSWNNSEEVKTQTLRLDGTPPISSTDCTGAYDGLAVISLWAVDALSGVQGDRPWYRLDTFPWNQADSINVSEIGTHTLTYYAIDRAGNIEPSRTETFVVRVPDSDPPITISNISEQWRNQPTTVTLTATDPISGVAATYYSTDNTTPTVLYSGPFPVSAEGFTKVRWFSVDSRDNAERESSATVKIDTRAPVTTSDVQESYIGSATVTLTSTDPTSPPGSGLATVVYRVNYGEWTLGTVVYFPGPGYHTLEYRGQDYALNFETVKREYVSVLVPDHEPPTTYHNMASGWTPGPYHVALFPHDDLSGVAATYYSLNGSIPPTASYPGTFTISQDGVHVISFYSVDNRGNVEPTKVHTLTLDSVTPVSYSDAQPSYMGTATITFGATDDRSGVSIIRYRVDSGAWFMGNSVTVGAYGSHSVDFYAIDYAGNAELFNTAWFTIAPPDTTPPTTTSNIDGVWRKGDFSVSLTATDSESAIDRTMYSINSTTAYNIYSAPFLVSGNGTQTVHYYSRDVWYNNETPKSGQVLLDNAAPVTASDATTSYVDAATINLFPADPESGVSHTRYKIDNGAVQTGTVIYVTGYSDHTVYWWSVDEVGNSETTKSAAFRIVRADAKIQESDPAIVFRTPYLSSFITTTAGGASGGGWTYSSAASSAIFMQTYGTKIEYMAVKGPGMGKVNVVFDGGTPVEVDLYAPALQYNTKVFARTNLAYAVHTIYVYWTGTKNPMSSGTAISLDTFEIEGNTQTVPDSVPPVTVSNVPAGWQSADVTVTLASNDTTTGVQGVHYTLTGQNPTTSSPQYTTPFKVSNEGQTTLRYFGIDWRGNVEAFRSETISIDKSPPLTTSNAQAEYSGPATVTLSPTDSFSGVAHTRHSLDGGAWTTGTVVPCSVPGTHTLQFLSIDNVGNRETTKSVGFTIRNRYEQNDQRLVYQSVWTTATGASFSGSSLRYSNVARSAAVAHFTGTEIHLVALSGPSYGIARVRLDGVIAGTVDMYSSDWLYKRRLWSATGLADTTHTVVLEWTGTKNPASSGTSINLDAVDVVGFLVTPVDTEPPTTTSTADEAWHPGSVTVTLTAADAAASVWATYYRVNGGTVTTYSAPLEFSSPGANTLEFRSVDTFGNIEATRTATVRIDTSPPSTGHNAPPGWVNGPVYVTLTASDTLSPTTTYWSSDGSTPTTVYSSPVTVTAEGQTVVRFHSVDAAGNAEAQRTATVTIDDTAPSTGDDAPSEWQSAPVLVTLSPSDALSGVGATFYRLNGSAPSVYVSPVAIAAEGTTLLEYWSADAVGNVEETRSALVRIDMTPPSTSSNAIAEYSESATITLAATDAPSGVAATHWRVDDGEWTSGTVVAISTPGPHILRFRSTDAAGNVEDTRTAAFAIRKRYEETHTALARFGTWTTATAGGFSAGALTYSSATGDAMVVGFRGTSLDWIALKGINYGIARLTLDGASAGTVDLYSASYLYKQKVWSVAGLSDTTHTLVIEQSGSKNASATAARLNVDALDVVGHLVSPVDTAPPVSTSDIDEAWRSTSATVTLTAADAVSAIRATVYRVGAGALTTYTAPFAVTPSGETTLEFRSIDTFGNAEETRTATVRIDRTAPVTSDDAPAGWVSAPVTLALTATDTQAGVASTWYTIDGGTVQAYASPFTLSAEGTTTVSYWSVDAVGNAEAPRTATVRIDRTAPVTSDDAPNSWVRDPVSLTLSAADPHSGVAATYYAIDGEDAQPYVAPVEISAEGTTTVSYWSVDAVGNAETPRTATVRIDRTAPVTTSNAQAEYTTTATVTLSRADALSGVAHTRWRLDGGAWTTGTVATTTAPGMHTLEFFSVDAAGNTETVRSVSFGVRRRYEQSDPNLRYLGSSWATVTSGSFSGGSARYTLATPGEALIARFRGTSVDWIAFTGPQYGHVRVYVDGVATATVDLYSAAFAYQKKVLSIGGLADTTHTVVFDYTGSKNASATAARMNADALDVIGTLVPADDAGDPVTTSDIDEAWRSTSATVTLTAADADSAVRATLYRVGAGSLTTYTAPFAVTAEGSTDVSFRSIDTFGNTEATRTATVRIDRAAPVTSDDAPAEWVAASPVTVTLAAIDPLSGTVGTYLSVDGGAPQLYTLPITVTTEGTTTVSYWSVDAAGNAEAPRTATVRIDRTAPVTSDDAPAGWAADTVGVTLAGADPLSGLAAILYSVDGGAESTYTAPVEISAEGTTTVEYRGVDAVGNAEAPRTATVRIDRTAPVTSDDAPAGWAADTVGVTLAGADPLSGLAAILYSVDGGAESTYAAPVEISAEGTTTVEYRGVDAAGNAETPRTATVRIDRTAPSAWDNAPTSWVSTSVAVAISAEDTRSGVSMIRYSLNGGATTTYTAPATVSLPGTNTLAYHAIDMAGNTCTTRTATVRIDTAAPNTSSNATTTYTDAATITLSPTDAHSGVAYTRFRLNGGVWTTGTTAATSVLGTHTLEYWSADNIGNREQTRTATFTVIAGWTRYEQNDTKMVYQGTWTPFSTGSLSAGSFLYTDVTGSCVDIAFTGTGIRWLTLTGPQYGIAKITLDASTTTMVDLYSASYQFQKNVWAIEGLSHGPHTLRIEWTGSKNAASTGLSVGLDAVDVRGGALTQAVAGPPPTTRYEQNDRLFTYASIWSTATGTGFSGNNLRFSNVTSCAVFATFKGTAASWIALTGPSYGIAKVTVDDGAPTFVDLYSTTFQYKQVVWSSGTLADRSHTVRIEWTGSKNASASAASINVDALDIVGSLTSRYYEQDEPLVAYASAWSTATGTGFSGGSLKHSNATSSGVNIAFFGSRIDWLALRGPNYGIAKVTLDAQAPVYVDLYSSSYQYKATAWSASVPDGAHTLKIEWTGTKNASATATSINLDALDVIGVLTTPEAVAPVYVRFEQTDSRIGYQGTWTPLTNLSASGASLHYTTGAGTATVTFTGTAVDVISLKGPNYGIAAISVDGGEPVLVDLYSVNWLYQQKLHSFTGLSPTGTHTLAIAWTGTRNPLAGATTIGIDAVDVMGNLATP